jgi:hypothetical protein
MRVGPASGDEVVVPAQQRAGRDQPSLPQRGGQQSAQGAEHGAVEPGHLWVGVGAAQHGDFVSEGQDLDVFGRV